MDPQPAQPNELQKEIREQLQKTPHLYSESPYRWVILVLTALQLILSGLITNTVAPIESKISLVYDISSAEVNSSVIMAFLVFFFINFPANHLIDTYGLRVSFLIGGIFNLIGLLLYSLVNVSFVFVIVGSLFTSLGQPFILNCPAKIATFWFFPTNRTLAVAIMTVVSLFGSGLGFMIPTLVVNEDLSTEECQSRIFSLYVGYAATVLALLLLNLRFMQSKPKVAPSGGAQKQKLNLKQSFLLIKSSRNLWKFFIAYILIYGSFITFASSANFLIKPYGFSDFQIAISAVLLILFGTLGSIVFSVYIKKTNNYKLVLRMSTTIACFLLLSIQIELLFIGIEVLAICLFALLGFTIAPIVPICYDLGCELAFPIGQAQVTGLLNGGALLWAFLSDLLVTEAIGYGDTTKSLIIILALLVFIIVGSTLFYFLDYDLKRKNFETATQTQTESIQMPEKISGVKVEQTQKTEPFIWDGASSPNTES